MANQLITTFAERFKVGEAELVSTLKTTCFKSNTPVTDAQMTALLIVADQYGLNPWTKEIYAFPSGGGIVPIVGLDGWSRIINENKQFDGMDFTQDDLSCTCRIYRKDRSHPIAVTEYMNECKQASAKPWQTHPKRMLRHKAMIQCARLAFGFVGIYDEDEAERIIEKDITPTNNMMPSALDKKQNEEIKNEAIDGESTKEEKPVDKSPPATPGQIELIRKKLDLGGITEKEMLDSLGIRISLDEITSSIGNECLTWIRNFTGA